jgi:hypothetical protein
MSDTDARTAIYNATVEMLRLNEKVGNAVPTEIVQCVNGTPTMATVAAVPVTPGQGGGARRHTHSTRRARHRRQRKTQIRRHK